MGQGKRLGKSAVRTAQWAARVVVAGAMLGGHAVWAFEGAAVQASAADTVFVGKVSQGGAYEVEASRLAEQNGSTPRVKQLAVTEVHDHEQVNAELKTIAARTGVPVAPVLNQEFQQRLAKLKSESGSAFDSAYLADMAQIHDKDEKLFAQEAVDGSAAWKPFAGKTDGIVKRHIAALKAAGGGQ